jgi:hypothetical protein
MEIYDTEQPALATTVVPMEPVHYAFAGKVKGFFLHGKCNADVQMVDAAVKTVKI